MAPSLLERAAAVLERSRSRSRPGAAPPRTGSMRSRMRNGSCGRAPSVRSTKRVAASARAARTPGGGEVPPHEPAQAHEVVRHRGRESETGSRRPPRHTRAQDAPAVVGEATLERLVADGEVELRRSRARALLDQEAQHSARPGIAARARLERRLAPEVRAPVLEAEVIGDRRAVEAHDREVQPSARREPSRQVELEAALRRGRGTGCACRADGGDRRAARRTRASRPGPRRGSRPLGTPAARPREGARGGGAGSSWRARAVRPASPRDGSALAPSRRAASRRRRR